MQAGLAAKPKDIKDYYAALNAYAEQGVMHEGALRSAFQHLLAETGRRAGWTLIPELSLGSIRPDGTFRDEYFLNRGYWEAKDTRDRLEAEIEKKSAKGYPLTNTIFEDTRRSYLYQNGQVAMQVEATETLRRNGSVPVQRLNGEGVFEVRKVAEVIFIVVADNELFYRSTTDSGKIP